MKIAICFYGQPRKYKEVLNQWKQIIKELEADIFIHSWYGIDRGRNVINIDELINDFTPKEIEISTKYKFIELIPEDSTYENQSYHSINQAYSINKSIQLLENYTNNFQTSYDIVIKTRFDITLHSVDNFINFVKNQVENNKLYVAGNHWLDHELFDDNIMVGNSNMILNVTKEYFNYTIDYINETKIIPGGEQNLLRYIKSKELINNIVKTNPLNFSLIHLPINEIIINENGREN